MNEPLVTVTKPQKRIAVVRFDRKDGKNALSREAMRQITSAFRELRTDPYLNVIVLTGSDGVFSVGADLKDPETFQDADASIEERMHALKTGPDMCDAVEDMEPIVIGALEGYCIGGGYALAVSCDLRVASPSLKMAVPEIKLGMNMSWGSIPRTLNLAGRSRTMRVIAMGETFNADTAESWGLVDYATDSETSALSKAMEVAETLAAYDTLPLRAIKRDVTESARALNRATSYADRDQFALASLTGNIAGHAARVLGKK